MNGREKLEPEIESPWWENLIALIGIALNLAYMATPLVFLIRWGWFLYRQIIATP